ncbi:MAG: hypothetical protein AAB074_19180 [Planctomycetota bacterium]
MRITRGGSWLSLAAVLVLFLASNQIAHAKDADVDFSKDQPKEVEKGDTDFKLSGDIKIPGDCGACFFSLQILLVRDGKLIDSTSGQASQVTDGDLWAFELGKNPIFQKAQVGDIFVVTITLTCIKDGEIVCSDTDKKKIKVVEPKKK